MAMAVLAIGATGALFVDSETSNGNTFTAGTLDLTIDGKNNTNVVKFNITNMHPGSQPKGSYTLANVGSLNGYLDVENIVVTDFENGCNGVETAAGDVTCGDPGSGEGELGQLVNLRLFVDRNGDGWISTGEPIFYNGPANGVAGSYDLNEPISAGSSTKIVALLDWWSLPTDNLGQGDSMTLDMTFELAQTPGQ